MDKPEPRMTLAQVLTLMQIALQLGVSFKDAYRRAHELGLLEETPPLPSTAALRARLTEALAKAECARAEWEACATAARERGEAVRARPFEDEASVHEEVARVLRGVLGEEAEHDRP